eukprot:2083192-Pyramimonas_sp.AAC.1
MLIETGAIQLEWRTRLLQKPANNNTQVEGNACLSIGLSLDSPSQLVMLRPGCPHKHTSV